MENVQVDVMALAQFGFAGLAAAALWTFIKDLVPRLLTIIEQNSQALSRTADALHQVVGGQQEQSMRLGRMDDRLLVLEDQHKYGVRECPLLRDEAGGGK